MRVARAVRREKKGMVSEDSEGSSLDSSDNDFEEQIRKMKVRLDPPPPTNQNCDSFAKLCPILICLLVSAPYLTTVEPVYNGHPWDYAEWLLYRGGLLIEVGGALGLVLVDGLWDLSYWLVYRG